MSTTNYAKLAESFEIDKSQDEEVEMNKVQS